MNDNLEDVVLDLKKRVEALENALANLSSMKETEDDGQPTEQ